MKKLKAFSFILILNIFLIIIQPTSVKAVDDFRADAGAAILMNASTGEIYYSLNADTQYAPASTTKIMTALLAFEAIERGDVALSDVITAQEDCRSDIGLDGSNQNIVPGEEMTLENLLYCMLVASANESCNIVGEYISGSISAFVSAMNARALELGCKNTHFVNTHGMPVEEHRSTAHDLAIIAAEAIKHPGFLTIVTTVHKEIPATNKSDIRYLRTTNELINPDRSKYYYSEAKGIKTGSSSVSGLCLVSSVELDGQTIISVVLGCIEEELSDGSYNLRSFMETKSMQKWFLDNFSMTTVVSTTDLIQEVPVALGEDASSVVARPQSALSMILPNDFDVSGIQKKVTIYSQLEGAEELTAPVSAGDVLGELSFEYNGTEYGPIPLVANTSVSLSRLAYIKVQIRQILGNTWIRLMIGIFVLIIVLYFAFVIRYNIIKRKKRRAAHEAARRGASNAAPIDFNEYRDRKR